MPRAAILAFDGCYASSLGGFADILQVANSHLRRQQGASAALFEWRFVSLTGEPVAASNGLQLQTHKVGAREHFDLVFIPSLHYAGTIACSAPAPRRPTCCRRFVWSNDSPARR